MLQESVFIYMNIIEIINEVITEMLAYGEITLEEAQRYYGTLVSWEIDKKDLSIINRMRRQFFQDREEIYKTTYRDKQEVAISQLWDKHKLQTKEALWQNAQKQKNIIGVINEEIKNWYHGTPDVRDIKTAGAFTPRTDTTTYISDPQKWDEQQVEMNNAKKSGNEACILNYCMNMVN